MLRVVLYGAAVCGMYGVSWIRRTGIESARTTTEVKNYAFDATQEAGIISAALADDVQEKPSARIQKEYVLIDSTERDKPETLESLKVPLQALVDGAISVRGKRFRTCSCEEALVLPDFDINNVVVNATSMVVGYFDPAPFA